MMDGVPGPLRFAPIFRRYLWGGRRLESLLGKQIGPGEDYAESWEIVDHGFDQSVVLAGPLAGKSLAELGEQHGRQLYGRHHPQPHFPLLFKFLDAQKQLSLQVHPNDQQAKLLDPPDLGKTEAWVILAAEPGSYLHMGLKRGVTVAGLAQGVHEGDCEPCFERIEPQAGDCYFLPAGMVHALGPGLVVAEIQQSSDTTYRLFDWNRLGPDGKPRKLHVHEALEVTDDSLGPGRAQTPRTTDHKSCERLVECDKFVLDRWKLVEPATLGGDDRFHILAALSGAVRVAGDSTGQPLKKGEVMLLPAAAGSVQITPLEPAVILDAYLP